MLAACLCRPHQLCVCVLALASGVFDETTGCVAVGGFRGWKGRGPSAVDSTPPGRPQTIPIRASKGMTCPNLREIGSGRGRGFSLGVFPTPLLLVRTFRFGGIYPFGAVGVATLAAGARVVEGFIDSGEVVPTAV